MVTKSASPYANLVSTALANLVIQQQKVSELGGVYGEVTNSQITEAAMGVMAETSELISEVGWKSWKLNPELTEKQLDLIADEWADVLAFFLLLTSLIMRRTGLTVFHLVNAYFDKSVRNISRFVGTSGEKGYGPEAVNGRQ